MPGEIRVPIHSDADTVIARQKGRALAAELGFSRTDATFIATAISEISRNITAHVGEGEILLTSVREQGRDGILVVAHDHGRGIQDVEKVLQVQNASLRGLGMGLRGARRLMDEFMIASETGKGTTVTMKKWKGHSEVDRLLRGCSHRWGAT